MVLAAVASIGAFIATHDPGIAVNAGGAIALVYLIILLFNAVKPPFPNASRLLIIAIAFVSLACVATSWVTQFYLSHWQRATLLTIRGAISYGTMHEALTKRALSTLEAYYNPNRPPSEKFVQVFNRVNSRSTTSSNILDTIYADERKLNIGQLIYVESISDSEVVLVGRDELARSQDSIAQVLKLDIGKPLLRFHFSAKGARYEFEY
jgi:hypothetical protein